MCETVGAHAQDGYQVCNEAITCGASASKSVRTIDLTDLPSKSGFMGSLDATAESAEGLQEPMRILHGQESIVQNHQLLAEARQLTIYIYNIYI